MSVQTDATSFKTPSLQLSSLHFCTDDTLVGSSSLSLSLSLFWEAETYNKGEQRTRSDQLSVGGYDLPAVLRSVFRRMRAAPDPPRVIQSHQKCSWTRWRCWLWWDEARASSPESWPRTRDGGRSSSGAQSRPNKQNTHTHTHTHTYTHTHTHTALTV